MTEQKGHPSEEPKEQKQQVPKEEPKQQEPGQKEVPENFKGKSPEELEKVASDRVEYLQKLQSEISQASSQKKELEQQLQYFQNMAAYYQQQQQQPGQSQEQQGQTPYPETAEELKNFDWENPAASIKKIVDGRVDQVVTQYQQRQAQANYQKSTRAFEDMRQKFSKSNPKLFKGIENDVVQTVGNLFYQRAQNGEDVSSDLKNPKTWETVAKMIKVDRNDFDGLMPDKNTTPIPGSETESPKATRSGVETSEIPPAVLAEYREIDPDITEEEVRKILKGVERAYTGSQNEFRFGG